MQKTNILPQLSLSLSLTEFCFNVYKSIYVETITNN